VDLSQLEIFLSIAEEKSFSRAAEKMLRTQPAISIAIKRLEEELGESLFDRSSKNGSLTEAGRILLSYAQRMLNLREEALEAVGELRGMFRGRLTIGANESTSLYLLPPLLMEYRKRHPNIKIEVFRNISEKIPLEVSERNLDFGFLSYDPMHPNLQSLEIHRDELVLVVPPKHRLAKETQVTVKDLGEEQFVAHNVKTTFADKNLRTVRAASNTAEYLPGAGDAGNNKGIRTAGSWNCHTCRAWLSKPKSNPASWWKSRSKA
jgi:DNA-binding transcriptional LysR family regulator